MSCSTSCTPGAPAAISTLISPAAFPAGANTPTAFVDPGDGRPRRLIATQEGEILVWDGITGTILPTPFLDLRDDVGGPVLAGGERGLLALAVEPDYATTGRLYVYYTRSDGDLVIARYQRSAANPDVGNLASASVILTINHSSASNHNGGWLAFGPDGFLYLSVGDGGNGCDDNQGTNGDGQRATPCSASSCASTSAVSTRLPAPRTIAASEPATTWSPRPTRSSARSRRATRST